MSEAAPELGQFGKPSAQIQVDASNWVVERHTSPDWDGDSQARLDDWLSQSVLHRVAYLRFEDAWKRSQRLTVLRIARRGQAFVEAISRLRPTILRSAAALLVTAAAGYAITQYPKAPEGQAFTTSVGGRETIVMGDGSRIELNTDTSLRLREAANKREVWLDRGEALFQIKHDAHRPLTVYAGNRRVSDLGTQFVMRREQDRLRVALLEGEVAIGPSDNEGRDLVLAPGNVFLATADRISVTTEPQKALAKELAWRSGLIVFHRTPLTEAAAEFNRYNREQIVVSVSAAGHVINGALPANNPEELAQIAHSLFGLEFARRDGKIFITRSNNASN